MLTTYTSKKLALEMEISIRTAQYIIKDIKNHYDISIVTQAHVMSYLKIPKQAS